MQGAVCSRPHTHALREARTWALASLLSGDQAAERGGVGQRLDLTSASAMSASVQTHETVPVRLRRNCGVRK